MFGSHMIWAYTRTEHPKTYTHIYTNAEIYHTRICKGEELHGRIAHLVERRAAYMSTSTPWTSAVAFSDT